MLHSLLAIKKKVVDCIQMEDNEERSDYVGIRFLSGSLDDITFLFEWVPCFGWDDVKFRNYRTINKQISIMILSMCERFVLVFSNVAVEQSRDSCH